VAGERELLGERIGLRPLTEADVPVLAAMFAHPQIARWWGVVTEDELRERLAERDPRSFAVVFDGATVGFVQFDEETDPDYFHASIDIALHPDVHGRGLGSDAVRTMARYLVEKRGHHRLTIDPAVDNEVAIACYRKVGFRPVGIMRRYERTPDGDWRDNLLMELLAEKLR
jgi:aminoglycoside 6'-N-acetyltransferase